MSASQKLFTIAGTSILKGYLTYRFANGDAAAREKVLVKGGHLEVKLLALPSPMKKDDAIKWLNSNGITGVMPGKDTPKPKKDLTSRIKKNSKKGVKSKPTVCTGPFTPIRFESMQQISNVVSMMGEFAASTEDDTLSVRVARVANRLAHVGAGYEKALTRSEMIIIRPFLKNLEKVAA